MPHSDDDLLINSFEHSTAVTWWQTIIQVQLSDQLLAFSQANTLTILEYLLTVCLYHS